MIRTLKYFFVFFLILTFSLLLLILWARSPAAIERHFAHEGLVKFEAGASSPQQDSLKLITYNIGYAVGDKNNKPLQFPKEEVVAHLNEIADFLAKQNPDIVALQEVDFNSQRTHGINQLDFIGKKLGLPYGAYVVTWNKRYLPWPYWPPSIQYGRMLSGQAVLSRYPIKNVVSYVRPKPANNPFWYNWFYLQRIVQNMVIETPQGPLSLWHGHLEAFDSKTRGDQAQWLAEKIKADSSPRKIALGDFNSVSFVKPSLSPEEQALLEDDGTALKELMEKSGLKNAEDAKPFYTFPSWAPYKKIDHVLYNDAYTLQSSTTELLSASDHLPVKAVLKALP